MLALTMAGWAFSLGSIDQNQLDETIDALLFMNIFSGGCPGRAVRNQQATREKKTAWLITK